MDSSHLRDAEHKIKKKKRMELSEIMQHLLFISAVAIDPSGFIKNRRQVKCSILCLDYHAAKKYEPVANTGQSLAVPQKLTQGGQIWPTPPTNRTTICT